MIMSLKCPSCSEKIQLTIEDNKIVSVSTCHSIETSEASIKKILSEKGIELG